jgi:uncharacterized protein YndB with AHSA1/START domain
MSQIPPSQNPPSQNPPSPTPQPETRSIVVEVDLEAPPETVWRALTETELLAAWLMPNDLRPEPGHRFTMQAQPTPGWDGTVACEVLAAEPPRRLSYRWRGGSDVPEDRIDTVVTWTLTAAGDGGTHLKLEHAGFTEADGFAFQALGGGWRGKLAKQLRAVVAELR